MHEMICNWFWKSISYQENIHFPLHNYMFVRSGIEFFKNHMKRLLVCCWLWSCSSCDHVALRNLILDARHSRSFDSRCIQKFVEVDCKIRLFICLFFFFGFVLFHWTKNYFANVPCFMHDSPVGFPVILSLTDWWNDNLWAELGDAIWVPVFETVLRICSHGWRISGFTKQDLEEDLCFSSSFSDYPRCAYIFIITTCGRASSTKFIPWSTSPAGSPICAKAPEKPRTCKVGRTRQVHQLQDVSNYWAARWWMRVFGASCQRWNWSWYLLDYHWKILCVCKPWIPIGSCLSAALFSNNAWNKLFLREVQGLDSSPKWSKDLVPFVGISTSLMLQLVNGITSHSQDHQTQSQQAFSPLQQLED